MKQNPRTLAQLILSTVVPTVLMSSFHVGDANAAPGLLQNVPFAAHHWSQTNIRCETCSHTTIAAPHAFTPQTLFLILTTN